MKFDDDDEEEKKEENLKKKRGWLYAFFQLFKSEEIEYYEIKKSIEINENLEEYYGHESSTEIEEIKDKLTSESEFAYEFDTFNREKIIL